MPAPTPVAFLTTLHGGSPNPFRFSTTVRFELTAPGPVTLELFDTSGRRVCTLLDHVPYDAGRHQITWSGLADSGRRAASGIYFLRMTVPGFAETRRIVFVR